MNNRNQIKEITTRIFSINLRPLDRWDLYCYVIKGDKYNYIIDTGCGEKDSLLLSSLCDKDKKIIVINTHYHWDHIWGNAYIKTDKIISSTKCYEQIENNWDNMLKNNLEYINSNTKKCLPNLVFENELPLDDDINLFFCPGHTVDGICVYDSLDKILFVGDNIGDDGINIVPELETSKNDYLKSLKQMEKYDFKLLLSGHNIPRKRDFLDSIIKEIEKNC